MAGLAQHVNMFQVLDVKLNTKLQSPESLFTCITLMLQYFTTGILYCNLFMKCCKLCACCENKKTSFRAMNILFILCLFTMNILFILCLFTLFFISKLVINFRTHFFLFKKKVWFGKKPRNAFSK